MGLWKTFLPVRGLKTCGGQSGRAPPIPKSFQAYGLSGSGSIIPQPRQGRNDLGRGNAPFSINEKPDKPRMGRNGSEEDTAS